MDKKRQYLTKPEDYPRTQTIVFRSVFVTLGLIMLLGGLFFKILGVVFIVAGFFLKKIGISLNKSVMETQIKKHLNPNSPFPDLLEIERKISLAIADKEAIPEIDFSAVVMTTEKLLYLQKQYGISFPVAHPNHPNHTYYLNLYSKFEQMVVSGQEIPLTNYDTVALQSFFDINHPGIRIINREPRELEYYIAGLSYYEYQEIEVKKSMDFIKIPEPVLLTHEPENEYDNQALAIWYNGKKLGYVPRSLNCDILENIERGIEVQSYIMGHYLSNEIELRIKVKTIIF